MTLHIGAGIRDTSMNCCTSPIWFPGNTGQSKVSSQSGHLHLVLKPCEETLHVLVQLLPLLHLPHAFRNVPWKVGLHLWIILHDCNNCQVSPCHANCKKDHLNHCLYWSSRRPRAFPWIFAEPGQHRPK